MLISFVAGELVLLLVCLAMMLRPNAANTIERRVACALRLRKRETLDRPIPKWQNVVTAVLGALVVVFVISDWSGLRVCGMDATAGVPTGSLSPESVKKIDSLVIPEMKSGKHVGIVVGVTDNGRTWIRGYGRRSTGTSGPPDGDSIFEIGSITKTFTCTSLALMAEKKQVQLSDPVSRYLPASVHMPSYGSRQITLVDLATHTSGLPRVADNSGLIADLSSDPYASYGEDKLYAFLSGHRLRRSPGAEYEYSNLGMGLLGLVLSRKSEVGYEEMVAGLVCKPLGLHDTVITLSDRQKERLVQGYSAQERLGKMLVAVPTENWTFQDCTAGAGALRSTARDMLTYLEANMNTSTMPLGKAMELAHKPRFDEGDGMSTGLGWALIDSPWANEPVIWHNGGTGGYCSFIGFCKKHKIGVAVLSNSSEDVDIMALRILKAMVQGSKR